MMLFLPSVVPMYYHPVMTHNLVSIYYLCLSDEKRWIRSNGFCNSQEEDLTDIMFILDPP